jgi:membrane-associated phospholipid phosphatase
MTSSWRRDGRTAELRRVLPRLVAGGVLVYALLAAAGLLLTKVFTDNGLVANDRRVSEWFREQRTPALNSWSHVGSMLSDTPTAIAVTVVVVLGLGVWLRRWREPLTVVLSISGELFIFLLVTATVHRRRPTVPHLDPAPPTSSFPSGHVGAAVALYGGLAVLLLLLTRRTAARIAVLLLAIVLWCVPVAVALSRLYRGMHFLIDVVAGALAGGLWMAIVVGTMMRATAGRAGVGPRPGPARASTTAAATSRTGTGR